MYRKKKLGPLVIARTSVKNKINGMLIKNRKYKEVINPFFFLMHSYS